MEYTKGEWEYTEELGANMSMVAGNEAVVCGLPNPIPSCNYEKELKEMRANAQLIASAPDLYGALKAMDEYLSHSYPTNMAFKKNAVDLMELALAKAEGK